MAWSIRFTTKHGADHFGSFDSYDEAVKASIPYEMRAIRLENEGVIANIYVEGPSYVGDLDALDDLLSDMEADWLSEEEEDN